MVDETEKKSCKNPTHSAATHNWEGSHPISISPRGAKGWCPTSGILAWELCTRKMKPQNVWFGKPIRLMSGDPKCHRKLKFPSWKSHVWSCSP